MTYKFVSDLRQVCGFLGFPPPITIIHDITEILLKVALNTINPNPKPSMILKSHLTLAPFTDMLRKNKYVKRRKYKM